MRKVLLLVPVIAGLGVLLYSWYAPDDGRKLLDRAIAAHGGEENVAKSRVGILSGKGKKAGDHFLIPYTWEENFDLPNRYKWVSKRGFLGQASTMTMLFIDGKNWLQIDNEPPVVQATDRPSRQTVAAFLDQLVDIRKHSTPLRLLPEAVVLDRPAVGFEAKSKDWGTVQLYFDKESALLLKLSKDLAQTGSEEGTIEMVCSGYQEHDGIALPSFVQMYRDGKLIYEETVLAAKFVDRHADSVFAKPQ
jgi:hypothetical protein